MKYFWHEQQSVTLCVSPAEPSCVQLAADDIHRDMEQVSRLSIPRTQTPDVRGEMLLAGTLTTPGFETLLHGLGINASFLQDLEEHYALIPFAGGMIVVGSDKRGTMWGLYECSRRFFGIDPLYLWTDHAPAYLPACAMPQSIIADGPHTYRFRGWFINDEDLMEGFCHQGKPEKDYHFQQDYAAALDMLIETALRLKQNMLIPCSHLDILRPEDESIVRRITERGVYVSMHHQEPVGVHQFTMDRYWAQRGMTDHVNFIDHRDCYAEVWEKYIAKWAQYDGVIWQLGLRGRGDRPVWYQNSRIPASDQERGQIISDAMAMQFALIRRACPGKPILSTATLWMEGMPLYKAGALHFPEGTMVIQSDFGPDQMWGVGYHETPRYPGTDYGVYYHLAFWGCGPHLIQGNRLEKIRFNFRQALEKGDTGYVVLNVANFREFVQGIAYEAQLTWNMADDDPDAFRLRWCHDAFEVEDAAPFAQWYRDYFACFAPMDSTVFPAQMTSNDGMTKRVAMKMMQIIRGSELKREDIQNKRLYDFASTDDFLSYYRAATETALPRFLQAHEKAMQLREHVPVHRQPFFDSNVLVQVEIMLGLYTWVNALAQAAQNRRSSGSDEAFTALIRQGSAALGSAIAQREKALYDRWMHWYDSDRLMNLPECQRQTDELHLPGVEAPGISM